RPKGRARSRQPHAFAHLTLSSRLFQTCQPVRSSGWIGCHGAWHAATESVQVSFYEELLHGTYVVAQAVFARAIGSSARRSSGPCPAAADAEAFARITRGSSSPQSHRPGRLRHGPAPRPPGRGGFAR